MKNSNQDFTTKIQFATDKFLQGKHVPPKIEEFMA
jgi:hypothetical protein